MRNFSLLPAVSLALLAFVVAFGPAMADSRSVTWVASNGDDDNTASFCSFSNPCQHLDKALSVTFPGGEVHCAGPYAAQSGILINITFSVTIDCRAALGSIVDNPGGFVINAPGDVVTVRGLTLNGLADNTIGAGPGTTGIVIQAASKVVIEDCKIDNFPQSGIGVTTSANTVVNIWNTSITNSANGISFAPTAGAVNGTIDHTKIAQTSGDAIASTGAAYFTVTNSVISNAARAGVDAGAGSVLEVDSSSVSNNRTGFATSGGIIRISHNLIYDNTANYSIAGGTIATSGDNKVAVNGSIVPNATITQQ